MIYFVGKSFAAKHLKAAAEYKGLQLAKKLSEASLVFISEDTPTDKDGNRDLDHIHTIIMDTVVEVSNAVLVLTSQVPPGFTRDLSISLPLYHQAETLRVKDAGYRALHPEYICVGCIDPRETLPQVYSEYLRVWGCPILQVTYEEAEFSKIAVNMTLASQVDNANRLCEAALKIRASWTKVAEVLRHDSRIGENSYLTPGDWKKSPHLLRDWVTLNELG